MSDISAGSVGTPAGHTTLIVRTPAGLGFVDSSVRNHTLIVGRDVDTKSIEKLANAKISKNLKNLQK